MKNLIKVDPEIRRVHIYKAVKDNCFEIPDYFIEDDENFEYLLQIVSGEGLKVYSPSSKSIDSNLPVIRVRLNKTINYTFTGLESFINDLERELDDILEEVFDENEAQFSVLKSRYKNYHFYKFKQKEEEKTGKSTKWWQFWK